MKFSKKEEYLRQKDKKLKKLIDKNGHIKFRPVKENQFDTLVGIIISQFISTKAADSIFSKIKEYFHSEYLNEKHFQKLNIKNIKDLGLSTNKARSIKQLSDLYLDNQFGDLSKLSKSELNEKLLLVFGVGPWSVNMFEIFCLGKLNVFSSKDAGLRLAMNKYGLIRQGSEWINYDNYADKWSPYKTIACLHLWKTVD